MSLSSIVLHNFSVHISLTLTFLPIDFRLTPSGSPVLPLIHSTLSLTITPHKSNPFFVYYLFLMTLLIKGALCLNWFVIFLSFSSITMLNNFLFTKDYFSPFKLDILLTKLIPFLILSSFVSLTTSTIILST